MGFVNYCLKVVQGAMLYKLTGVCLNERFLSPTREIANNPNLEILYNTLISDPLTFKLGLSNLEMCCIFTNYLKNRAQVKSTSTVTKEPQVELTRMQENKAPVQRRVVRQVAKHD